MGSKFTTRNSGVSGLLLASVFLLSCSISDKVVEIPNELVGTWKSSETKITVRKKEGFSDFSFYSGNGEIVITFNNNKITGSIGIYNFSNGTLVKGDIYKVVCDSAGALFADDPVESKQISMWLHSITENKITGELRLTQDGQKYPMADFTLTKQ